MTIDAITSDIRQFMFPGYGDSLATPYAHSSLFNPGVIKAQSPGALSGIPALGGGGNLMAQIGWLLFAKPWINKTANRHNMMMGTVGGGSWNYRDMMAKRQQEEQLAEVTEFAKNKDIINAERMARNMVGLVSPEESQDKKDEYVKNLMDVYKGADKFTGGLLSHFMPGGSVKEFSGRIAKAQMSNRLTTEVDPDQVESLVKQFESRFTDEAGVEDKGFTRGFSRGEFGQMAQALGQRGALKKGDAAVEQLKEFAGSLDAIRDLIGDPSAPIPKLIDALDKLTGGGVGKQTLQRMTAQMRKLRVVGSDLGITAEGMAMFAEAMGARAQGMGLTQATGAQLAIDTLLKTEAMIPLADADRRAGQAAPTREQLARLNQDLTLRGAGSKLGKDTAAIIDVMDTYGEDFVIAEGATEEDQQRFGEAKRILTKINKGESLTRSELETFSQTDWGEVASMISPKARARFRSARRDEGTISRIIEEKNIGRTVSRSQRMEIKQRVSKFLQSGNAGQVTGITAEEAEELLSAYGSADTAEEGMKAAEEYLTGIRNENGEQKYKRSDAIAAVKDVDRFLSQSITRRNKIPNLFRYLASERIAEAEVAATAEVDAKARLDEAQRARGKGVAPKGVRDFFRFAMSAAAEGKDSTEISKLMLKSLGAEEMGEAEKAEAEKTANAAAKTITSGGMLNKFKSYTDLLSKIRLAKYKEETDTDEYKENVEKFNKLEQELIKETSERAKEFDKVLTGGKTKKEEKEIAEKLEKGAAAEEKKAADKITQQAEKAKDPVDKTEQPAQQELDRKAGKPLSVKLEGKTTFEFTNMSENVFGSGNMRIS